MGFTESFNYYWYELSDPRARDVLILRSPFIIPLILFSYLYFILRCGPRFMANREPYLLKTYTKLYNIMQIITNAYVVYLLVSSVSNHISWSSTQIDYNRNLNDYKMITSGKLVIALKLIDLSESFVFVLRKKFNQLTVLHIYHHISTALITWLCMRYYYDGMILFVPIVNCAVHVLMYTYYFLSTLGPEVRRKIQPFKRILTIVQMIQLSFLAVYTFRMNLPGCEWPKILSVPLFINFVINLGLFYNFYQKTYKKSRTKTS